MTNYSEDKLYKIDPKFTALNGSVQYYSVEFDNVTLTVAETATEEEKATAQANLLRVLEVLRTRGGQPIITSVDGKTINFTLEQPNVFGKSLNEQGYNTVKVQPSYVEAGEESGEVSVEEYRLATAKAVIESMFAGLKSVDGKEMTCTATVEASF